MDFPANGTLLNFFLPWGSCVVPPSQLLLRFGCILVGPHFILHDSLQLEAVPFTATLSAAVSIHDIQLAQILEKPSCVHHLNAYKSGIEWNGTA
jgi:hypothetical protein